MMRMGFGLEIDVVGLPPLRGTSHETRRHGKVYLGVITL